MQDKQAILIPGNTYHIYNRANGNERLFLSDENYRFFLKKYTTYISPIADTFCYCLMPNHFHFLLRIKEKNKLLEFYKHKNKKANLQGFENLEGLISHQFSNFFNAYSKAFNKQQHRKGSLFMHTFKRKIITDQDYFRKVMHYIHYNPIEAGLVQFTKNWKYSSYRTIISKGKTKLEREESISYFNDLKNFIHCHQEPPKLTGIE
ncbi:hypothetical protein [Mesonia aquimarina]|uniref:hypothetical protein n=1 Tax=Mesonia aquimarina TaxID=1504967 RepID=UPI000EF5CD70|nr:hypothetical protein [Mesonia aquimarina]